MASGQTLIILTPQSYEPPSSNYATFDTRNSHPVLDFDDTATEGAAWSFIMPRNYSGNGLTVYLTWGATSATSGTGGWLVSFERIGSGSQDTDSDSYASAQTVTATTVPATSGNTIVTSVAVSNGANIDSLAAGELGRIRVQRDVANDTATGDLELFAVEIKET